MDNLLKTWRRNRTQIIILAILILLYVLAVRGMSAKDSVLTTIRGLSVGATDDQVKAILFGFAAGQELSEHTASQPAVLHFLQGEAELTLGDDEMEAQAGTWVHMPPNLAHSVVAKTPVVMLLLLMQS